jgi:hypothetical protein
MSDNNNLEKVFNAIQTVWARTNYHEFMKAFFPETSPESPCYDDEYHIDKWEMFRDKPFVFYCSVDKSRRNKLFSMIQERMVD